LSILLNRKKVGKEGIVFNLTSSSFVFINFLGNEIRHYARFSGNRKAVILFAFQDPLLLQIKELKFCPVKMD